MQRRLLKSDFFKELTDSTA